MNQPQKDTNVDITSVVSAQGGRGASVITSGLDVPDEALRRAGYVELKIDDLETEGDHNAKTIARLMRERGVQSIRLRGNEVTLSFAHEVSTVTRQDLVNLLASIAATHLHGITTSS